MRSEYLRPLTTQTLYHTNKHSLMKVHPHYGKFYHLSIIMEYADDGDLYQSIVKMAKQGKSYFPEDDIWALLIQVTRALHHLHNLNIMHRDLKSANVFLN